MNVLHRVSVPLLVALGLLLSAGPGLARSMDGDGDPERACPFAAHNAYPEDGKGGDKQLVALDSGLRHIETDMTWDARRKAVVVTHDGEPDGDEPELAAFLEPIWDRWEADSGEGFTMILDCKSDQAPIARVIDDLLASHASSLSQMKASAGSPFRPGRITVCISGNDTVKRAYQKIALQKGRYLAFADRVAGDGHWKEDPASYVPEENVGFYRYLTVSLENLMKKPQGKGLRLWLDRSTDRVGDWLNVGWFSGANDTASRERLEALGKAAADSGWIVRVYTANRGSGNRPATELWKLCVGAGIEMIATDDYAAAARWWRSL